MNNDNYSEIQHFSNPWISTTVIGLAVVVGFLFVNQVIMSTPVGDYPLPDPLLWTLFSVFTVALPILLLNMRLTVSLLPNHISLTFFPFFLRTVRYDEIDRIATVELDRRALGSVKIPGSSWTILGGCASGVLLTPMRGRPILAPSQDAGRLFSEIRARMNAE